MTASPFPSRVAVTAGRTDAGPVANGASPLPVAEPARRRPRFGPSALATWANAATAARVGLTVPLLLAVVRHGPSWTVWAGWTALSTSDGLDGWLARRHGATRSGAFLDPLADKVLVLGGLGALVARGSAPFAPGAVIAAREVAVSLYRSAAGRRGISLPARRLGKAKTIGQLLAVGSALFPPTASAVGLQRALLWGAAGLTVVSGVDVVLASRATGSGHDRDGAEGIGAGVVEVVRRP